MSLTLDGDIYEQFEWRLLPEGIEVVGTARLRKLSVTFPGWLTPRPAADDAVGIDIEHEAGVTARVRLRSGRRIRLELSIESDIAELVTVPGPLLSVEGAHEPVCWFGGADAEIALPSEEGPGLLTQRRGIAMPTAEPSTCHLLDAEIVLRARQMVTAAWTYEAFPGDLWDMPSEPSWLPLVRYCSEEYPVEISAPDGVITVDELTRVEEFEGEYEIYPTLGHSNIRLWGPGGQTFVEIGATMDVSEIRRVAIASEPHDDLWCYLVVRDLLERRQKGERSLDQVDAVLGGMEENPTAWSVCASHLATKLGLPLSSQTQRGAAAVVARGQTDDLLLLGMHRIIFMRTLLGKWPVGDFDRVGLEALAALRYGRITTDPRPERGRDVAIAKLWAAGMGETVRGLNVSSRIAAAEGRLVSRLAVQANSLDVAWLSVQ